MAANILNDIRRTASAVMTPMRAMPTVKKTATVRAAMELMRKSGCRALPVYDKRRHKVLGILTIESIIRGKACPDQPILDLAEPPVFVGADSPVARACAKLERAEAALAVVADETRALGIITVDDILDELIGEGEPGADVAARESAKG
jgi:CBS domain containing-hemolysin-like protein